MAKIALPYTIVNGDPVDAGPVQGDYSMIERHINQEVIERGGTVAMTAQLKLFGNPVAALDAAPKQYVDQMLPIGFISMFGGAAAPVGGTWLLCDNTEYEVAIYPELAAVLGNVVAGKFRVPNLKDRFAVGSGGAYANGTTGGRADAIVVAHTHPIDHTHPAATSGDDSPDHSHQIPTHGHGNNFGIAADGSHEHSVGAGLVSASHEVAIGLSGLNSGDPIGLYVNYGPSGVAGYHGHGLTGGVFNQEAFNTTGVIDARHRHSVPAAGLSGSSGAATSGVAGDGQNIPPYCAVSYIIRAK